MASLSRLLLPELQATSLGENLVGASGRFRLKTAELQKGWNLDGAILIPAIGRGSPFVVDILNCVGREDALFLSDAYITPD